MDEIALRVQRARWKAGTLQEVIEAAPYTSIDMFREVQFAAEQELIHRFPPPDWAAKFREQTDYGREAKVNERNG